MSVDLPAPFSPSSACTSPRRSVRSMWSLAVRPPKRLTMPRSSSASSAASDASRVVMPPSLVALRLLGRGDLAGRDLLLDLRDLRGVLLAHLVELADAHAAVLDVEHLVGAALERAVLRRLDGIEDRDVDLLRRARHDLRAEERLIVVDADRLDLLLLGGVDRAEAALAGGGEDDLRALVDLVQRQLLALRLVDEVLRVAAEHLHVGVRGLRARLVARDVVVHGGHLLAADDRHG